VLILVLLMVLRFLSGWLPILLAVDLDVLSGLESVLSYFLIALFIWLKRDQLSSFFFDKLSIYLILIFTPLQTLLLPLIAPGIPSLLAFPRLLSWILILIFLVLFLALRPTLKAMPGIENKNWRWFAGGAAGGIGLSLLMGILFIPWTPANPSPFLFDYTLLLAFPYQLGYAGAYEEPLFRGILSGELHRSFKWNFRWIILLQAALFSLAHGRVLLAAAQYPGFVGIFIAGIVFGWLAYRSRSIATSMAAHAFYNAFGLLTSYLIQWLFI